MSLSSFFYQQRAEELAVYLQARCEHGEWDELDLDSLSRRFAMSKSVLTRAFRDTYKCTIRAFIIRERISFAKRLLLDVQLSVGDVATRAGYTSLSNFSRDYALWTGESPLVWRKRMLLAHFDNLSRTKY